MNVLLRRHTRSPFPFLRLGAWLLAAGTAITPAHAAPQDVRPLPGATGAIRFVVEVPEPLLEPAREGGQTVRLAVPGYGSTAPQGHPLLPRRVVMVAVPPTGEVTANASATAVQVVDDVRLARAPFTPQGRDAASSEARARAEAIAEAMAESGYPPPIGPSPPAQGAQAKLIDVGWMRNQRVAHIEITPADYDVAARRLSIAHRIEVEVVVSGASAPSPGARPAEDPDPFEHLYREALVNYQQGRAWRREARPGARAAAGFGLRDAAPMRSAAIVPDTSIYAGREWVKLAVNSAGFYKVRLDELRGLKLFRSLSGGNTSARLDSLRLYTWPGFPVLPEGSYCDACGYREVAMGFVEDTPNGILDKNGEYFYFYAVGASDWSSIYDPALPDTVFINHPYEKTNYYYLAVADTTLPIGGEPKRITTLDGSPALAGGGEVTPATFDARLHYEVDAQYWPNAWPGNSTLFWEKWFWRIVEMGDPALPTIVDAPGVDTSQPSRMRMRCWGVTQLAEKSLGIRDHYLDTAFNGAVFGRRSWNGLNAQTYDTTLVGLVEPSNTLSLQVPDIEDENPTYDANRVDVTALAWVDLFYARRFEPVADALEFDSSPAGGSYLYKIGPFSSSVTAPPRIFDVTDPLAPIEIQGGVLADDTLTFLRAESGQRRYRVFPDARVAQLTNTTVFMAPSSSLNNLRAAPDSLRPGADYLVIYYDGFKETADLLADWRRTHLPIHGSSGPYETAAVPISAVYDQFSGGRTDAAAIRNFLRAAFYNWQPAPTFVTLLGDASYDFKDILGYAPEGLPGTLLPAYEGGYVSNLSSQYATDDWMLNVDTVTVRVLPEFFGGRIPAGDAASAMAFVRDKLIPYEKTAPLGEWRNRVMLIGDDHKQGARGDRLRWLHMRQTAELDTAATPAQVDRAYVYLHTYPDGASDTKPGAKADVVKNLNGDGVLMWNFTGHGSPFKISDEGVFLDSDAGSLTNAARPALFVSASCDVGKYHDPQVQSLGERLVMNPGGGCIGVISATELAFTGENAELNKGLYRNLFERDMEPGGTGQYFTPVSEALLAAKTGSANSQKYQLMGDAALRLNLPRFWVELTLKDGDGNTIDTLQRGGIFRFEGRILDQPGGTLVPFAGSVAILIEDSAPIDMTFACPAEPGIPPCSPIPYRFRAAPAFRGDARVQNGTFTGQFVVPLDAVLGARGRIRGYVSGDATGIATATDGAGSDTLTLISGTAPSGDNEGPRIGLSFAGGATAVRPDAELRIDLSDDHGILITGHTIQNGIIVTMDNNSNTRVDVTSSFRYSPNSYQAGTATFTLPGLTPGAHTIAVSAADNLASGINAAQHRSSAIIDFEVSPLPPLTVQRAFLFPNPTRSGGPAGGGQFVIDAPGDPVNVLLHLYTVSGRLIRTLKAFGGGRDGQIQIPWDGLDAEGDRLANGTYLFMVQVNGRKADGTSNALSRAVSEGRVVIVGR